MADDFGNVTVTPPTAPVRDVRRLREVVVRMDEATGKKVEEIEVRYTLFSSTNEKTDANPIGVVSQGGANLYKGANADAIKAAIFKAGAKAEIEARLAEDNVDE